jgi:hypothetical protein
VIEHQTNEAEKLQHKVTGIWEWCRRVLMLESMIKGCAGGGIAWFGGDGRRSWKGREKADGEGIGKRGMLATEMQA